MQKKFILFRVPLASPSSIANVVTTAIATRNDWSGLFTVVESNRIRLRPLPGSTMVGEEPGLT